MSDKLPTKLAHIRAGRPSPHTVNPPVAHGSTVLFNTVDELYDRSATNYGRMGLGVQRELEAGMRVLEGAEHARLTANGMQACALAIAASVDSGDHILVSSSAYGPTRHFCETRLKAMGVEAQFFDPLTGKDIDGLLRDNTKAIMLETPGSLTFDMMDTRAIVEIAKARNLTTITDNTWGAGVYHKPLALGVDISVQALTKYVVGHSDVFGGAVMSNRKDISRRINAVSMDWGLTLSPDDSYIALRGLRTLFTRLAAHEKGALEIAHWLAGRSDVAEVIHPALPTHPGHDIWKRDFTGSCGLFGLVLKDAGTDQGDRFCEALDLLQMGFSWGGYESLIIPCDRQLTKSHRKFDGPLLRLHIGLEDVDDIKHDLEKGFAAL